MSDERRKLSKKLKKFVELHVGGLSVEDAIKQTLPESATWSENTWRINRSRIFKRKGVQEYYDMLMNEKDHTVSKALAKEAAKEAVWTRDRATSILVKALEVLADDFTVASSNANQTFYNLNANKARIAKRNDTARALRDLASELNKLHQFDKSEVAMEKAKPIMFAGEDELEDFKYDKD